MASITLRSTKGSPLTSAETDTNFSNLNQDIGTRLLSTSYTAADVLSKLLTVTGPSSGSTLSADTLKFGSVAASASTSNTASTIVARDATGNFSAGNITVSALSASGTSTLAAVNASGDVTVAASSNTISPKIQIAQIGAVAWNSRLTTTSGNYKLEIDGGMTALDIVRNGTSILSTTIPNGTFNVTGTSTLAAVSATALSVTGTSTLAAVSASGSTADSASLVLATQSGTGRAALFTRNVASATRALVSIEQSNAAGGAESVLDIRQATSASKALKITNDGSASVFSVLGTGATAVNSTLDVTGTSTLAAVSATTLVVGAAAFGVTGEIRATNNITAFYSDERLKTKVGDIENALDKVCSIETLLYHANETAVALGYDASIMEVGVTAQSVQKVQPEIVVPAPIDANYLTVRYEKLVPLLVEAIKELAAKIIELENK